MPGSQGKDRDEQDKNQSGIPAAMAGTLFVFQQITDALTLAGFIAQAQKRRAAQLLRCGLSGRGCWFLLRWCGASPRRRRHRQLGAAHPAEAVLREVFVSALFAVYEQG